MKSSECLFPQIQECPHRHYSNVHLNSLKIDSIDDTTTDLFSCRIRSHSSHWTIIRSKNEFHKLDRLIHTCLIERHFSSLPSPEDSPQEYIIRLNGVLSECLSGLKCVLILNWFESDNNGFHLIGPQDSELNRTAIGAAFVVRQFEPISVQSDKRVYLSLAIGDMVSVLDSNDFWTKGKKGFQVGFFPSNCIQIINSEEIKGQKRHLVVRRRISSLWPQFLTRFVSQDNNNVSEIKFKTEILNKRVFGKDLSEQLFDGKEIPEVVTICCHFIEQNGILDGIYRLSGISSNISRLREQFDSGQSPDLSDFLSDIHCVSSCLKLFFRLLPNPLLTFEFYDRFVSCIRDDTKDDTQRLDAIRFLVRRLPPPHFRTLRFLIKHLRKVSEYSSTTGMTEKNLSIVWAPNLLRSKDIENRSVGGDLAALQVIGIQAVLTEYLIQKSALIFDVQSVDNSINDDSRTTSEEKLLTTLDVRKGCFGRHLSERRTKSQTKNSLIRWKSFESFFAKKDNLFLNFGLKFAKIQRIVDLVHVLPQFDPKLFISTTVWTTTPIKKIVPIVRTIVTTLDDSVVVKSTDVRNDAIVVRQNISRERIERIKAQRRQQIREQFSNLKPIPIPRKTLEIKKPVPTPRKKTSDENIRILTTSGRHKRTNWNENAISELLNKK